MAWKMYCLSGVYSIFGSGGVDINTFKQDYHKHGEPDHRQSKLSVEKCNEEKGMTGGVPLVKGYSFIGTETLA